MASRVLFWLLALACMAPLFPLPAGAAALVTPGALVAGTLLALTLGNPFAPVTKRLGKTLLQASVVLLGFSMDLAKVLRAGREGLVFSLISIALVYALGWGLQRWLGVRKLTGLLVSTGTAICGGSAIAAVSSVVDAPAEDVTVAVGAVFLLNGVALLVFPPLGRALGLSQHQFGVWSGIAIHDIASVVGAGVAYGPQALDVGTAVKLSRVLYLIPITLLIAWFVHRNAPAEAGERKPIQIPWFVGLFLIASLVRSYVPIVAAHAGGVKQVAAAGFALTLFLIGAGLTRATLKAVGVRPLAMGALLWLAISAGALIAVRTG